MDIPDIVAKALTIPGGTYYTLKSANIRERDARIVLMEHTARTNAGSTVPVIGTVAFNPCFCIIAFNKRTKTAALLHEAHPGEADIRQLISAVRQGDADRVQIHIMGGPMTLPSESHMAEEFNEGVITDMKHILEVLDQFQNVQIKTFDTWDKPKPAAVLFDARNGRLIRGTQLNRTEGSNFEGYTNDDFDGIESQQAHFDGTVPELQKQKQRG